MNKKKNVALKQLNLRVDEETAEAFRIFCSVAGLTQNAGLRLLLQSVKDEDYDATMLFQHKLQEQNATIEALKGEIEEIKKEQAEKHRQWLQWRRGWIDMIDQMVLRIAGWSELYDGAERTPLRTWRYYNAPKNLHLDTYDYPESAGCGVLTVDYHVYSRSNTSAVFICGRTEHGQRIKLRWYPIKEYIGISPRAERYAWEGEKWLFGWMIANDGAVDIKAGIPLASIRYKPDPRWPNAYEDDVKRAVDEWVAKAKDAERKNALVNMERRKKDGE